MTPEPPPNGRNGSGLQGMLSRACWYSITNTEKKQAKIFTFFAGVQFIPFRSPSPRMRGGGFQPGGAALLTVFPFFARFCSAALPRKTRLSHPLYFFLYGKGSVSFIRSFISCCLPGMGTVFWKYLNATKEKLREKPNKKVAAFAFCGQRNYNSRQERVFSFSQQRHFHLEGGFGCLFSINCAESSWIL